MENLYTAFPYSRLQESRINRQVRNYPGSSVKSAVAQDEWLELNNKEHANLPSVRSLEGVCVAKATMLALPKGVNVLSMPYTLPAPSPSELCIVVVWEQWVGVN